MNKNTIILSVIILIGFVLRLTAGICHSYSSDELSAITRLDFKTLEELINLGVKTGDMHPAGVQLFMKFWSELFGTSEAFLRFPFVILGTIAIWLVYRIGKRYSENTGLFAASIWSVLLFPIIQSELARPYSPGLFFILLSAHFILKLLLDPLSNKERWYQAIWLGISISGCMYTHYFAFLTVLLMSLSGLFWVKKNTLLPYISAGCIAIILFSPHLSITLYQTSIEGGIQWLAPPGRFWLLEFLQFSFNTSWIIIGLFMIAIVYSIFTYVRRGMSYNKHSIIFLIWFFGTYLLGFIISHYFTPVLKFPVMLFSLPFFIILLSNFISPVFTVLKGVFPVILILATLTSTTIEKKLWKNHHFEVFKEIVIHINNWERTYTEHQISKIVNVSNPDYLNYYVDSDTPIKFELDIINYEDADKLEKILHSLKTDFLAFGFSGRHTPIQFLNQCLDHFPYIVESYQYNNSAIFLLSKIRVDHQKSFTTMANYSFPEEAPHWQYEPDKLDKKTNSYLVDSINPYRPQIIIPANIKIAENKHFIKATVKADIDQLNEVTIVAIPETKTGEVIKDNYGNPIWIGQNIEQDLLQNGTASFAFSAPPQVSKNDQFKIYVWSRNNHPYLIKSIQVEIIKNIWNN